MQFCSRGFLLQKDTLCYAGEYLFYNDYFSFYAKGSASIAILDFLGIGETEHNVIVYPNNEKDSKVMMEMIANSEFLKDVIAFRVPVKGISSLKILNYFLKEDN